MNVINNIENQKFWNRLAKFYNIIIDKDKEAYKRYLSLIRNQLRNDMTVLEIGTGTGVIALKITDFCKNVVAIDYSSAMIDEALKGQIAINLQFMVEDGANLSLNDNSFDVVIIANTLHILPNPLDVLESIHRVLKPDGLLIAPTFIRKGGLKERTSELLMSLFGFRKYGKWTTDQYYNFLEESNWNIVYSELIPSRFPTAFVLAKDKTYKGKSNEN